MCAVCPHHAAVIEKSSERGVSRRREGVMRQLAGICQGGVLHPIVHRDVAIPVIERELRSQAHRVNTSQRS